MKTIATIVAVSALMLSSWAENKATERVQAATTVLDEIMAAPDKGIPGDVFRSAKCVAVVPSMKKAGFMVGGNYGKGVAVCKNAAGWSAPAPFTIEGGSFGLQIGGQAVDLVMLIMNDQGMNNLLSSKVKLGADMSAAAGPVGRQAEASTDWKLKAQVLTYSRAKGAFAGVSLNGASIRQDNDATTELYGKQVPFRTILTGGVPAPAEAQSFVAAVQKYTSESQSASSASAGASTGAAATPSSGTQPGSASTATPETPSSGAQPGSTPTGTAATPSSTTQPGSTSAGTAATPSTSTQPGSASTGTGETPSSSAQPGSTSAGTAETPSSSAQQPGSTLPQSSETGAAAPSSAAVQAQIAAKLNSEPGLSASNVSVNVTDDAVTLSGSVPTEKDKDAVRRIASSYAGTRRIVDSNLIVK